MKPKTIYLFLILTIIGIGFFAYDWFGISSLNTKTDVEGYKDSQHEILGLLPLQKSFIETKQEPIAFINKNDKDIPINVIKFYQEKYNSLPTLSCMKIPPQAMKRSYIVSPTTYDVTERQ